MEIMLINEAKKALQNSYAPYSNFNVGAALLCASGKIYLGCNIENAAYSSTVCAERTAFFKAISEGEDDFVAIAIVGGKNGEIEDICPPCGVCRQVMAEFCDENFEVVLAKKEGFEKYKLKKLLPLSFKLED